jgi:formylmethanofuran dehydrogenase subunit C
MSTLRLTLREPPAQRVDLSPLTPDHLAGKSLREVAAIELGTGNRRVRVGDLFAVAGNFATQLEIRGACEKLDRIGAGMTHGRIVVRGHAGGYVGAGMQGGVIEVEGSVGAYAASGMRAGLLHVTRDAGDFLAAGLPGERRGMRGGTVVVGRNAGARVGDRMRRGMVLIEGNAGDYCGSRMIAGTIAVAGGVGSFPGMGMRRGTLLLDQAPVELVATFNDCGESPNLFLTLLVRSWRSLPGRFATLPHRRVRARRYMGDLANDGRGEILVWV